ncbi:hypothetical protein [Chryseobacterium sp. CT-SW4]|uniref:hypothetical protein n=1 Tax=Chryseobacterium sp. SW-1 TaxID=3157343 RepID=UPI003B022727
MNIKSLKNSFYNTLYPPQFSNKNVERLHSFITKNNGNKDNGKNNNVWEFIHILKAFSDKDIQYFFDHINGWDSYYLVSIADKVLDTQVKANINYDLGAAYCKVFCSYEKFDSYYLIDNLEYAVTLYHSKPDLVTLINLTNKIQLLFQNDLIKSQQYRNSMTLIKKLQNEL